MRLLGTNFGSVDDMNLVTLETEETWVKILVNGEEIGYIIQTTTDLKPMVVVTSEAFDIKREG